MKRYRYMIAIALLLYLVPAGAYAQTPYQGGSGDGYAGAEWVRETVSASADGYAGSLALYPSPVKSGGSVSWELPEEVSTVSVFGLNGRLVQERSVEGFSRIRLDRHSPGCYWLKLTTSENRYYYARLIITRD